MKKYVVGFLFDKSMSLVVLIVKNRPEWQKGKLNGIGGMIDKLETPSKAMEREFLEETGLSIPEKQWEHFHSLQDELVKVYFYYAISENVENINSMSDEKVGLYNINYLNNFHDVKFPRNETIPNLRWLIPMCLDKQHIFSESKSNITKTQVEQDIR